VFPYVLSSAIFSFLLPEILSDLYVLTKKAYINPPPLQAFPANSYRYDLIQCEMRNEKCLHPSEKESRCEGDLLEK
jgi:hypothetical protein